VPALRTRIRERAPGVDLTDAAPFGSWLEGPLAEPRLDAVLLLVFAAAAVSLAALGLFGVVMALVGSRTREIGGRMALGATAPAVHRMVVGRALAIALAGSTAGIAGALVVNHMLGSLLFGVRPTDGASLAVVTVLILGIAVLASLVPARYGTRIDPLVALRAES